MTTNPNRSLTCLRIDNMMSKQLIFVCDVGKHSERDYFDNNFGNI